MKHLKGLGYDAAGIEHSFAIFLEQHIGKRGLPHDADVFRLGDTRALGKAIEQLANHLQTRMARISWPSTANGSSSARVQSVVQTLRSLSVDMQASAAKEPQDYHWLIIGNLVLALAAVLDQFGA